MAIRPGEGAVDYQGETDEADDDYDAPGGAQAAAPQPTPDAL